MGRERKAQRAESCGLAFGRGRMRGCTGGNRGSKGGHRGVECWGLGRNLRVRKPEQELG